jgi:RND family efflux transporter MFP subunit
MNSTPVLAICLLTAALLLSGCGTEAPDQEPSIRPVRVTVVGDFDALERRSFPGRAQATQEVELSFRVQGPLIGLPVKIGDKVQQGDLVARIDPRDFEVQLRNADGQLQRTNANLDRASSEYKRLQGIRRKDPQLVSEVQLERAREAFELASADTNALQATVDAASDELADTWLKAPFDGTIVSRYVENFEYIQSQQPVLRLLDSHRIEFLFSVPETMISMVGGVTNMRVRFDAFPDLELPAELYELGTEASAITRTYPVTVIMDQPEGVQILPGMAGRVTGTGHDSSENGAPANFLLPVTAVFSAGTGQQSYVWVIDANTQTVSRREVELGSLLNHGMEILSGLTAGDMIATAGVNFLQEGQQVRPQTEQDARP